MMRWEASPARTVTDYPSSEERSRRRAPQARVQVRSKKKNLKPTTPAPSDRTATVRRANEEVVSSRTNYLRSRAREPIVTTTPAPSVATRPLLGVRGMGGISSFVTSPMTAAPLAPPRCAARRDRRARLRLRAAGPSSFRARPPSQAAQTVPPGWAREARVPPSESVMDTRRTRDPARIC